MIHADIQLYSHTSNLGYWHSQRHKLLHHPIPDRVATQTVRQSYLNLMELNQKFALLGLVRFKFVFQWCSTGFEFLRVNIVWRGALGFAGWKVFYAQLWENGIAVMWDLNSLRYTVLTVLTCSIVGKICKCMVLRDSLSTLGCGKELDVTSVFHNFWSTKLY